VKVSLYLDEDSQDNDLIDALRLRGADVIGAWAAGMRQRDDEQHLLCATAQGRTLYGFNTKDFYRLHTELLTQGKDTPESFSPSSSITRLVSRCGGCSDSSGQKRPSR
jgi:hypothetical protein